MQLPGGTPISQLKEVLQVVCLMCIIFHVMHSVRQKAAAWMAYACAQVLRQPRETGKV